MGRPSAFPWERLVGEGFKPGPVGRKSFESRERRVDFETIVIYSESLTKRGFVYTVRDRGEIAGGSTLLIDELEDGFRFRFGRWFPGPATIPMYSATETARRS